ncbi:hypothetical protein GCM10010259_13430 [Streptomyces daghestanicus]|uniref:Uncharacterized protein n=2 Tax=Streptomyces TaxID=1883 RepID=A0A918LFL3_STRGD|nr:hypothetical protein GCM10010238_32260 [Streptomyces niveoruber]GGT00188.1 hypothetical protein GCM10010240_37100 [Streptomyces griseoviridis]GGU24376.1 hypothetical protein GCM10010259_13430 [Streptomyces daghestanicus]GHI29835.1 hypothetical protein Sdagh_15650 [Streptomyces daghestanicus]
MTGADGWGAPSGRGAGGLKSGRKETVADLAFREKGQVRRFRSGYLPDRAAESSVPPARRGGSGAYAPVWRREAAGLIPARMKRLRVP